jgi:hypothetical protein
MVIQKQEKRLLLYNFIFTKNKKIKKNKIELLFFIFVKI